MRKIILQGAEELAKGVYYEIDTDSAPLGTGGSGTVYRGVMYNADGSKRDVAVKFLFNDLSPIDLARARKEASIQIRNDNLLEMLGFIELTDDIGQTRYHVVSELLSGVMLYDMLKGKTTDADGNTVPLAEELLTLYHNNRSQFAIRVVKSVLSGVMALHDSGYIHRDIDPSNIMITTSGHIKLIDFGLAKSIAPDATAVPLSIHGQFLGKPGYAAPEVVLGDVTSQNKTTDIYAIGILLFELITGHLPFQGTMVEVLEAQKSKDPPLQDLTNRDFRKIIGKAMEKKQADRFQSAAEFRVALDKVKMVNEPPGPLGSGWWHKLLIAVLLALITLSLVYFCRRKCITDLPPVVCPNDSVASVIISADTTISGSYRIVTTKTDSIIVITNKCDTTINDTIHSVTIISDTLKIGTPIVHPRKGRLSLDYGTWNGYILNGKPHGYGTMIYTKPHPIGNGEIAQPGDTIEGNYQDGHWVDVPTWLKSSGETKKIYNL